MSTPRTPAHDEDDEDAAAVVAVLAVLAARAAMTNVPASPSFWGRRCPPAGRALPGPRGWWASGLPQ